MKSKCVWCKKELSPEDRRLVCSCGCIYCLECARKIKEEQDKKELVQ